jgi:hypothetical protein
MKQYKITISFSCEYQDVYVLLKSKPNVSRYICELVRDQAKGDGLESRIEKIVSRMLCQNSDTNKDDLKKAVNSFDF